MKVLYLALRNLAKKWDLVQGWKAALNRFASTREDRFIDFHINTDKKQAMQNVES